jgi:hypothetical protein
MISPFTPLAATGLRSRRTIRHTPAGQRTDRRRALRPAHPVGEFLLGLTREIDRERIMGDELTPGQGLSAIDALQIEGLPMIASVSQRRSARWLDFLLTAVAHSFSQEPPLVR